MFLGFFKWSISHYFLSYSITNLLGLIGLTLTQHRNYETIKNNFHQNIIILSHLHVLYQSMCNCGDLSILFSFKYSTAHFKYDTIVYHKSESVTSFMHKWLHVLLNGQPIEIKLCSKYVRTQRYFSMVKRKLAHFVRCASLNH